MRYLYGLAGLALAVAVVCYPVLVMSFSGGAPAAFNGSPVSLANGGGVCTACHGSFDLNSGTGSITIDAPTVFMPGETVEFTITLDNTTPPANQDVRQGFMVSVEDDAAVEHVGALVIVDATNTQAAGDDYVTHTSAGNGQSMWTVGWTAPADGEAPTEVTIHVAANAANFDFGTSGDYIYTNSASMRRSSVANEGDAQPLAARLDAVYPNPFVDAATITFTVDRPMDVAVTLYDGVGRVVRVLDESARGVGQHTVPVRAAGLATGTYFVQVRSEAGTEVQALTLAR